MPKRGHSVSSEGRLSNIAANFKQGQLITDINGKKWKLGKSIGNGGFGQIYEISDDLYKDVQSDSCYVAKFERHTNGPLFVEVNCYLRIAKADMITEWKQENNLKFLGMPHYVSSGSHYHKGENYRFLIIPKYKTDIERIFKEKKLFNLKTVLTISTQILDTLEYIHGKGYVHSDIKAANIMLGTSSETVVDEPEQEEQPVQRVTRQTRVCRKVQRTNFGKSRLRPVSTVRYVDDIPYLDEFLDLHEFGSDYVSRDKATTDHERVYLVDYGLATKYLLTNGDHKQFCTDERRAHVGTMLFCSRDAHKGVLSRRADLENLAYNMVYWLTGTLPWMDNLDRPEEVEKKKTRCFNNLTDFLQLCFELDYPEFLLDYFNYLNKLQFEEQPDYEYCRKLFRQSITSYGYKDDSVLDFDNLEGTGRKKGRKPQTEHKVHASFLKSPLMPLHSNIVFKRPKLRKKTLIKNKESKDNIMTWSQILTDPEEILKQSRERKVTEDCDTTFNMSLAELKSMNPTYAMLDVFHRVRNGVSPKHKGESLVLESIGGYNQAMMSVYTRMVERLEMEFEMELNNHNNNYVKAKEDQPKKRRRGRISPARIARPKSHSLAVRKKDPVQLKKSKSAPLTRRTYSLRG